MNNDISTRDCVTLIIYERWLCRSMIESIESLGDQSREKKRQAKKLRETGNPLMARRADTLDKQVTKLAEQIRAGQEGLKNRGRAMIENSACIDEMVPQSILLDLLNVNCADRHMVKPGDGFRKIVFVYGLEDSAMYRGGDFKQGPLAQAYLLFMFQELAHNDQLKQAADKHLFGKGGLFEFVPTYALNESGVMVRQPPKLRLADKCDIKES